MYFTITLGELLALGTFLLLLLTYIHSTQKKVTV